MIRALGLPWVLGTGHQGSLICQCWLCVGERSHSWGLSGGAWPPSAYISPELWKSLWPCLSHSTPHQGLTTEGEKTSYVLTNRLEEGDPRR